MSEESQRRHVLRMAARGVVESRIDEQWREAEQHPRLVEFENAFDFIRGHGVDAAQGYLFSPPLPLREFTELLVAFHSWPSQAETGHLPELPHKVVVQGA